MYPPRGGRLDHGRGQHVEHDLVGDQVTAALAGGDLAAERAVPAGLRAQQVTGGDVPGAGPGRQPLALGALAGAGRGEQQQPHGAAPQCSVTGLLTGPAGRPG